MKRFTLMTGMCLAGLLILSCAKAYGQKNEIKELSLYAECTDYDNALSTIASEIRFIPLATDPPVGDPFHIYDVAVSENFVFILELYKITQYNTSGKYIRNVGKRGQGPEEYVQLSPPLQLDNQKKILYTVNSPAKKIMAFGFDGKLQKTIPIPIREAYSIEIIDSTVIAIRESPYNRIQSPNFPFIRFMNYNGKEVKSYESHLPTISREDRNHFGADVNFAWKNNERHYCLEYGADTIFQIVKESLTPVWKLTGKMKPNDKEYFQREKSDKLLIIGGILRPNAAVYESDGYIIFKLVNSKESFYKVYNKATGKFHRTFHKDEPPVSEKNPMKNMNYFTDDIVSGLSFRPNYQSNGWAISFISAEDMVNKKKIILDFIKNHPSAEGEKLKAAVLKMDEFDNPVIMMVKFK